MCINVRKYLGSLMLMLGKRRCRSPWPAARANPAPTSANAFSRISASSASFSDDARNEACIKKEAQISSDASKMPVWVVPTNEEIVVARECAKLLEKRKN